MVGTEAEAPPNAAGKATSETREDSPQPLIDLKEDSASSSPKKRSDSTGDNDEDEIVAGGGKAAVSSVHMVKTSCGDNHNIGLDCNGVAYSLPSPLEFDTFPSDSRHRVIDVACGKEHCLLLTEHGQVCVTVSGNRLVRDDATNGGFFRSIPGEAVPGDSLDTAHFRQKSDLV